MQSLDLVVDSKSSPRRENSEKESEVYNSSKKVLRVEVKVLESSTRASG
jgi:hypothetical protein